MTSARRAESRGSLTRAFASRDPGANTSQVLYIAGEGRSGSTVLAALLGTYENYVSVGEIRGVWRAVETDELCGCGLQFSQCPFWTEVGRDAFGGWEHVDHERLIGLDATF